MFTIAFTLCCNVGNVCFQELSQHSVVVRESSRQIILVLCYYCLFPGTIKNIVLWIEKALESPKRRFKGFCPMELTQGLDKLAVNDGNKSRVSRTLHVVLPMCWIYLLLHLCYYTQSSVYSGNLVCGHSLWNQYLCLIVWLLKKVRCFLLF